MQSTTFDGQQPKGRLILYTSERNMPNAYKELKPRWKVSYRTGSQMIGSKLVSELIPSTPGSQYVYATVELSALEPDYVDLGRKRPNDGPLVEALDLFTADKIRALAKEINDRRRQELDQEALDQVHEENQKLDSFKNRFLPSGDLGGDGDGGPDENGKGPRKRQRGGGGGEYGKVPDSIELAWEATKLLRIGKGVSLYADSLLDPRVLDANGKSVPGMGLEWYSSDRLLLKFGEHDRFEAVGKGSVEIWVRVKETSIESPKVHCEVCVIDHVLLTPRSLEIPQGKRRQVIAEVTNDEGQRTTNVFLNWKHDADDPLIVRIHPTGWVTGNRLGKTTITAGAGDPNGGGVWARIGAEVTILASPEEPGNGRGSPRLLVTGRDKDPATGEIREGDPEQPSLWQEVSDYQHNVWWLNIESPEASFFFKQREEDICRWRAFHAQKVVDMVIQVRMREEYDAKGDAEPPDLWVRHKAALDLCEVLVTQAMWDKLKAYVLHGEGLQ